MNGFRLRLLAGAAVLLSLSACAPVVSERGYIPDIARQDAIVVGTDSKTTVEAALGTPTNVSNFGDDVWYYVSATEEQYTFYRPENSARRIFAVTFDEANVVTGLETFGLEDGRAVAFNDEETPTRGREITFLQQMFGNIGRTPIPTSDADRR